MFASRAPPTVVMGHNPGMCPDWESNLRPFGSQAGVQSTEPHEPGREKILLIIFLSDEELALRTYLELKNHTKPPNFKNG